MAGATGERRNYKLVVWRQKNSADVGHFQELEAKNVSPNESFLEMLDSVNQELIKTGQEAVSFESDCREGICGSCSCVINGNPHGPDRGTATCQLHMRTFKDGETLVIEPFRSEVMPVVKDLIVDRSALDRIIESGGYISVRTGNAQDANSIPVAKEQADLAFQAAACIGCGACVAACVNGSATLFTAAKVDHLSRFPQGEPEHDRRVLAMVSKMDELGFGHCSNTKACTLACPKEISFESIARLNRSYLKASLKSRDETKGGGGA
jgi:succinate dehydrogenase / fumarate reductase iron-sulfur subunit